MTPPGRRLRVTVLMGGDSSERAISLSTGSMIRNALNPAKYEVSSIDTRELLRLAVPETQALPPGCEESNHAPTARGTDAQRKHSEEAAGKDITLGDSGGLIQNPKSKIQNASVRPDIVFIALHGKGGEDGTVQGMLEMMRLPYTGSGVLASALAMDKAMTKRLLRAEGIPIIEDVQVFRGQSLDGLIGEIKRTIGGLPVFIKPNSEGSTFGCALVEAEEALFPAVEEAMTYDASVLIERYIKGVEITVGVLGNTGGDLQPLPTIEIVPRAAFYDYESKYAEGGSEHLIPARLPASIEQAAREIAVKCHSLLRCRGMSRTDMIVSDGRLYVLEINTIPGMTPTSLLPQAAAHAGIDFPTLLDRLIGYALEGRR